MKPSVCWGAGLTCAVTENEPNCVPPGTLSVVVVGVDASAVVGTMAASTIAAATAAKSLSPRMQPPGPRMDLSSLSQARTEWPTSVRGRHRRPAIRRAALTMGSRWSGCQGRVRTIRCRGAPALGSCGSNPANLLIVGRHCISAHGCLKRSRSGQAQCRSAYASASGPRSPVRPPRGERPRRGPLPGPPTGPGSHA